MLDLKKLKSLFVIEEEVKNKKKAAEAKETKGNGPKKPSKSGKPKPNTSGPKTDTNGKFADKFYNMLIQAIESNNLDGFDYLEYRGSLRAMENIPMDEATKFKSAFATASTLGLTVDHLIKTATHYKGVLEGEKEKFRGAVEAKVQKEIVGRAENKSSLEKMINDKAAKIKALTAEIEKHQTELGSIQDEVDNARSVIEKTKNDFLVTYDTVISQIDGDVKKISNYLKS